MMVIKMLKISYTYLNLQILINFYDKCNYIFHSL